MRYFSKKFQYTCSVIAIFTIVITSVMDLNDTHMTNPLWAPHARFHWACQYFATILISVLSLYCLYGKYKEKGNTFSKLFIGLSPLYFWGMFIPAILMPGTSTAPDGMIVPQGFPRILTVIHPNFIIGCVVTIISVLITSKELKNRHGVASKNK